MAFIPWCQFPHPTKRRNRHMNSGLYLFLCDSYKIYFSLIFLQKQKSKIKGFSLFEMQIQNKEKGKLILGKSF